MLVLSNSHSGTELEIPLYRRKGNVILRWEIKKNEQGMLIKTYLQQIHHFSRRLLISLKKVPSSIQVNGTSQWVTYKLKREDILTVALPDEKPSDAITPEKLPLDIIYEDAYCLVVNKPAGQACLPSMNHRHNTLANGLTYYYQKNSIPSTVHIVTRLDVNTSGLVLVAKNQYVHSLFSRMQQEGNINRVYEAIVHGEVSPTSGIVDAPIARKEGSIIERTVDMRNGKYAKTNYRVLYADSIASWVEIKLETGRTHQIRVHFQYLGHSLYGDNLYGGSKDIMLRQALHCKQITMMHPIKNQPIQLEASLPEDMGILLKRLMLI
ncbi:pseudouridine synthase [Oceanobacillus iheyensis HTE831]|uniref:Pseudouridine synthase n=1 Tax=Oceanobacillus iheyensis (strain DSM 14371 / CIP 107618 / JCM 11309 / KCTC 3954 / HTE831) TaxID=221109 RepID=Q8ERS8_OCEIH|nr:pseudouridine synthase [Oceanobacillus iheyensis HTE831]